MGNERRSPVARDRVAQALKDQVQKLAATQHRGESEIVREAVDEYVSREAGRGGSRYVGGAEPFQSR